MRSELKETGGAVTPAEDSIHGLFHRQALRHPDAVAIAAAERSVSYAELDSLANRLARHLIDVVGCGGRIGMCFDRSIEAVTTILAILKAGATWVPVDPALPPERIKFMLEDSGVPVVVTQESFLSSLGEGRARAICVDRDAAAIRAREGSPPDVQVSASSPAYIIYTSGSTGRPKGVELLHGGVVNMANAQAEIFGIGVGSRVLQFYSFAFDASVFETFMALLTGATLVLESRDVLLDPIRLGEALRAKRITSIQLPPPVLASLPVADLPDLKIVMVGGEQYPADVVGRWARGRRLFNVYGPTEATVWSTYYERPAESPGFKLPIGRAIPGCVVHVLDTEGRPVGEGGIGEIHLGGAGLGSGYVGRPDLTAERFVPNRIDPERSGRLFKTGDLGRVLTGGGIEFLGRNDNQVKVRGHRIELEEIERTVLSYPGVKQAATALRADSVGEPELVCYYVDSGAGAAMSADGLREHLASKLPVYMVPSGFIQLEAMPLLPNDKVDRSALAAARRVDRDERVDRRVHIDGSAAPRSLHEKLIAQIWADVLGRGRGIPGVYEDFFLLGGHSLKAAQVVHRVREATAADIPLSRFLREPTVAALALLVDEQAAARLRSRADDSGRPGGATLPPGPAREPRPAASSRGRLSSAQRQMWMLDQRYPASSFYNVPFAYRIDGELNVEALRAALGFLEMRHDVLRAAYRYSGSEPVQVIGEDGTLKLELVDLSGLPETTRSAQLSRVAENEAVRPFDLSALGLLRSTLIRLDDREHFLVFVIHHIIADGWSAGVFVRELALAYGAFADGGVPRLPPVAATPTDFAEEQARKFADGSFEPQLRYWTHALAGVPAAPPLRGDRPHPRRRSNAGARMRLELSRALVDALNGLARQESASLFMVLLAGLNVLMYRWSRQPDVVIGTVVANRMRSMYEDAIGFFANTLAVRTSLSGDPQFQEVLRRVRDVALGAYDHQEVPFDRIVEALSPPRNPSYTPLFQVMFVLQNAAAPALGIRGAAVSQVELHNAGSKYDLTFELAAADDGLGGWVEYNTDIFDHETVERLARCYVELLGSAVGDPHARIARLPMLPSAERAAVLGWASGGRSRQDDHASNPLCIYQLFEDQCRQRPDAVALACEGRRVTYGKLDTWSAAIARQLRELGVGPNVRVGICADRSAEAVAGIVGILRAGGAYVPIDPRYPRERREYILADSGVCVVLVQEKYEADLAAEGRTILRLGDTPSVVPSDIHDSTGAPGPDDLAYVIYTSGTTGRPKGAQVTHRNVARLFTESEELFGFDADDVWTLFHSLSFDFSVWELWGALAYGGRLVVVPHLVSRSPDAFHDLVCDEGVTVLNQTPSSFQQFVAADKVSPRTADLRLRFVIFGGEALDPWKLDEWVARHGDERPRLVNMYGITETTVHVSYRRITASDVRAGGPSNVGRPLPDMEIYLLDAAMEPVPPGVPGEIYVGGGGVCRGYLDRPELTASRFVQSPFGPPGTTLYRSGDLGRWLPGGEVEYLGRGDDQLKIRGFRIEPGEVEAALRACPGVQDAVAVPREDAAGGCRLVAYVVPEAGASGGVPGGAVAAKQVLESLRSRLPEHMVPSAITVIAELPLTPNGKLDRAALPAPDDGNGALTGEYVAPRNEDERRIAEIWAAMLGVKRVGAFDDFFDLGGHSLLATRAVLSIRQTFGVDIPVRCIFEARTVALLAEVVQQISRRGHREESTPDLVAEATFEPPNNPPSESVSLDGRSARAILLTGATGFLGAFLLHQLLTSTRAEIYCLVRCRNSGDGLRRIEDGLIKYGLAGALDRDRLRVIPGDLSKPRLGLSHTEYEDLAGRIDAIYHNGAWVNFVEPYSRLSTVNVQGTRELLSLAFHRRVKPFHYISSSSVFGSIGYLAGVKVLRESDDISLGLGHGFGGYVHTKWVAEQMVWNAHRLGLPVTVFRCGLILGESRTGMANVRDYPSRLVKGCIQLGAFYNLRNKIENFIPVDTASAAIVHIACDSSSFGSAFHVVNPHHLPFAEFWHLVEDCGYPMEELPYARWLQKLQADPEALDRNALSPFFSLFLEKVSSARLSVIELFQDYPVFETEKLIRGLSGSGIVIPRIDEALVRTWMSYYARSGFIQASARAKHNGVRP